MHGDRLIFRGATVLDGSGSPGVVRDVGVADGRITLAPVEGRVIDAAGRFLAPGFIDMHSHDDAAVVERPALASKTFQGVTTVVFSSCGLSPMGYFEPFFGCAPLDDRYLEKVRASVNVAWLVPHAWLRRMVMGFVERPAHSAEVDVMVQMLCGAGAFGMSTNLRHEAMAEAGREELTALASAAGLVSVHLRSYRDGLEKALDEALALAPAARLHFPHVRRTMLPRIVGFTGDASPFDEDFENTLRWPRCMIGSDQAGETFVRALASPALPLEERVRRLSGLPAETLRLADRGFIREGHAADLVLFAEEIELVVVNGTVVAEGGKMTGATPGAKLPGPGAVKKA